jgi:hypothetical protein
MQQSSKKKSGGRKDNKHALGDYFLPAFVALIVSL